MHSILVTNTILGGGYPVELDIFNQSYGDLGGDRCQLACPHPFKVFTFEKTIVIRGYLILILRLHIGLDQLKKKEKKKKSNTIIYPGGNIKVLSILFKLVVLIRGTPRFPLTKRMSPQKDKLMETKEKLYYEVFKKHGKFI
jgi:hypothetical protein